MLQKLQKSTNIMSSSKLIDDGPFIEFESCDKLNT